MPTFICIKCNNQYNEGDQERKKKAPRQGYCQECKKSEVKLTDRVENLEIAAQVCQVNKEIHGMCLDEIQGEVKEIQEKMTLTAAVPDLQEKVATLQDKVAEIPILQDRVAKLEGEMAVKLKEIESQTQIELQRLKNEMEESKMSNDFKFRLELAKMESEEKIAIMKEKCKADIEIARLQAEGKVQEKKELNKALDKLNKSKSTQATLALLTNFSQPSTRANSTAGDNESVSSTFNDEYTSLETGNFPDAPSHDDNDRWTKLQRRVNTAPLPNK